VAVHGVGLVCVAMVAACYAPTVPTGIACPDGVCPNGQSCVAGFCDGDGPSDGNTSDTIAPSDGSLGDAAMSAGWAVPTRVQALSGPSNDWGPSISTDELALYLNTDGPTPDDFKIYVATRATKMSGWGALMPVQGLDLAENEYHADISADNKELVYAADLPPAGLRKLTRVSANQPWIGPTPLQLDGKQSPGLFANDLRMIVEGSSIQEYTRADRNTPWTLVRTHATLAMYRLPGISADGLEIYVIRNTRMYRATRMSIDQVFGMPAIISFGAPFDSYDLFDPELSADGHTMYVSVDTGSTTDADIYVTTR